MGFHVDLRAREAVHRQDTGDLSPLPPETGDVRRAAGRHVATSAPNQRRSARLRATCRHFRPKPATFGKAAGNMSPLPPETGDVRHAAGRLVATSARNRRRSACRWATCRHFRPKPATFGMPLGDLSPLPPETGDIPPCRPRRPCRPRPATPQMCGYYVIHHSKSQRRIMLPCVSR